jgi:hypothetical protein
MMPRHHIQMCSHAPHQAAIPPTTAAALCCPPGSQDVQPAEGGKGHNDGRLRQPQSRVLKQRALHQGIHKTGRADRIRCVQVGAAAAAAAAAAAEGAAGLAEGEGLAGCCLPAALLAGARHETCRRRLVSRDGRRPPRGAPWAGWGGGGLRCSCAWCMGSCWLLEPAQPPHLLCCSCSWCMGGCWLRELAWRPRAARPRRT